MALKIGDTVRFLNSVGGGIVRRIEGNLAYVDEDGFETPVLTRECVVVAQAQPAPTAQALGKGARATQTPEPPTRGGVPVIPDAVREEKLEPLEETPGGEKLNLVLAYEPDNIKDMI